MLKKFCCYCMKFNENFEKRQTMQIKQQQLYATVRSVVSELIIEIDLQSSGRIQYCTVLTIYDCRWVNIDLMKCCS